MEITVLGPGAIGTLLGSLLRVGGHDVTLVGRRKTGHEDRPVRLVLPDGWLLAEGLRHESAGEAAAASAGRGRAARGGAARGAARGGAGQRVTGRRGTDAFLVTLGRHHLRALRRPDFTRLVSGEGPVYMLNCDPSEAERLALTPERCRFGLTLTTAVKLQEGEVELARSRSVLIVEKHEIGRQLFDCLEQHGFEVLEVDDALPFLGSFFLFQLLFLPVALCSLTLPAFLAAAEGRELAKNILLEGFLTMEKSGQPLAALPMMDPQELLTGLEKKPLSFQVDQDQPDRSYNTVLQAYLRGRQVETAHLNRRLVEIASSAGLHLVWNWRVAQKAGRVAGAGFYRDPAELLRSLQ